ncbi:MAG: Gfo/Idh/MocA family oxidoreductase [Acidimicrobiia bacterium]
MLELALIGAGSMGANHGRVAMGLRDAVVTWIIDPDETRGKRLAEAVGARFGRYPEMAAGVDAAIIAAPTHTHRQLATDFLEAGCHVLVEKPIAPNIEEAEQMIAAAERCQRLMMVGHIERFNPAVLELHRLIDQPVHVTAERVSPYTARIEEGVTSDLMIHDLDLISFIAGNPIRDVSAIRQDVHGEDDLAMALMTFESGMTASALASRIGQDKVRRITITQADEVVRLDLIRQAITIHRVGQIEPTEDGGGYRQSGLVEVPFLRHRGEPLLLELGHFIDSIIQGRQPRVTGQDGLRAIRLVEMVKRAANSPAHWASGEPVVSRW